MEKINKKNNIKTSLLSFNHINTDYLDKGKISRFANDISDGIKNYVLFQKFFSFKWPYWLQSAITEKSISFHPVCPIVLSNNSNRSWINFANLLSSEHISIDSSGMISPFDEYWSIETWIVDKENLLRPQERIHCVKQNRDINTGIVENIWKEKNFEITQRIFGINSEINQAIAEIDCNLTRDVKETNLLIVIRPYNITSIGGINSIEYISKKSIVNVNGYDKIYIGSKPDSIFTGSGQDGDIKFDQEGVDKKSITCKYSMATIAFGFKIRQGLNKFNIRLSLDKSKGVELKNINLKETKDSFINSCNHKIKRGFQLSSTDKIFEDWFYGTKISALNFYDTDIQTAIKNHDLEMDSVYHLISGYNRMGYHEESIKIIDSLVSNFNVSKKRTFQEIINACYIINSISDYFRLSRDIEYIKSKFCFIRKYAEELRKEIIKIKKVKDLDKYKNNSLRTYIIQEHHIFDIILLSHSFKEFSYMARCLGIFNDEIVYNKEAERIEKIILEYINILLADRNLDAQHEEAREPGEPEKTYVETGREISYPNEYFCFNLFAGYPFRIRAIEIDTLRDIVRKINKFIDTVPLYLKSIGGCHIHLSIIYAINLLLIKDDRVHVFLEKLFELGEKKYALPEVINPKSGFGSIGKGDSVVAAAALFTLLRSIFIFDSEERLEIFPVPREKWFNDGVEIILKDAPSIFGAINLTLSSKKNEIYLFFNQSPKYVPPEIMINLPFKTAIKEDDDFIVKKKIGNSYLINGWPSTIKFTKKK